MKRLFGSILLLVFVLAFKTPLGYSQSLTVTWGGGAVKDHNGTELSLGSAIEVLMPGSDSGLSNPVEAGFYFLGGSDSLIGIGSGFSNPLPYVPVAQGTGFLTLDLLNLPQPAAGEQVEFSIALRVWDNVNFTDTFDGTGNYMGDSKLLAGARHPDNTISYFFDTPVQTLLIDGDNPGGANYSFDISGLQTNNPFPLAGPVPEPNAMLLAGFGFIYLLRKVRRK